MSKMRIPLIVAGCIVAGVAIGSSLLLRNTDSRVGGSEPPWITVRFDSLNVTVKYQQGDLKRSVPLAQRERESDKYGPVESIVITDIVDPGEYEISLTTDQPGCSAGSEDYSWGNYETHRFNATRQIVMWIEPSTRVPKIIGEVPLVSARYPDCVRVHIARDDGVQETHDLHFSQFE